MNTLSTNKLILGSGVLSATGNQLYLNQLVISASSLSGITGTVTVNQSFNMTPYNTGASFTLGNNPFYINTGSSAVTWTMPIISSSIGRMYQIKNRGNTITLIGQGADLFFSNGPVSNFAINSGEAYTIGNSSYYWEIM
jgi:hypothetical protein